MKSQNSVEIVLKLQITEAPSRTKLLPKSRTSTRTIIQHTLVTRTATLEEILTNCILHLLYRLVSA